METTTAELPVGRTERGDVATPEPVPPAEPVQHDPVAESAPDDGVRIRPITVDEFYRMSEAGIFDPDERIELLDGQLIVMPTDGPPHGANASRLLEAMILRFAGRAIVRAGNALPLNAITELLPDVGLVHFREDWYSSAKPGPRDVLLLIEVSDSSLRYDRGRKLRAYAKAGIPEYWVVDLVHGRVEVYADPRDDAYAFTQVLDRDESIAPRAFPDDVIAVSSILLASERPA